MKVFRYAVASSLVLSLYTPLHAGNRAPSRVEEAYAVTARPNLVEHFFQAKEDEDTIVTGTTFSEFETSVEEEFDEEACVQALSDMILKTTFKPGLAEFAQPLYDILEGQGLSPERIHWHIGHILRAHDINSLWGGDCLHQHTVTTFFAGNMLHMDKAFEAYRHESFASKTGDAWNEVLEKHWFTYYALGYKPTWDVKFHRPVDIDVGCERLAFIDDPTVFDAIGDLAFLCAVSRMSFLQPPVECGFMAIGSFVRGSDEYGLQKRSYPESRIKDLVMHIDNVRRRSGGHPITAQFIDTLTDELLFMTGILGVEEAFQVITSLRQTEFNDWVLQMKEKIPIYKELHDLLGLYHSANLYHKRLFQLFKRASVGNLHVLLQYIRANQSLLPGYYEIFLYNVDTALDNDSFYYKLQQQFLPSSERGEDDE